MHRLRLSTLLAFVLPALSVGACNRTTPTALGPQKGPLPTPPASSANLPADDGQWLMAAKDYANTRFSGLTEITPSNVGHLRLAWSFSTGVLRGHEAAPLVVNGTMYLITPYPNVVYALDLTKPGAPVKWTFKPKPSAASQGVACCDTVNRGAAYSNGRIIFNTLDNHTMAVDANTGAQLWDATLGDINRGETITMSPLVVKGKVLVGNSGGEMGVRGWLTALDENDGSMAWRAYHTGPDKDVLIGPGFKPFYADHKGKDLGVTSWPPDQWKIGGASAWGWVSYDPELDLVYYGTSNPGPWNADLRPGDNKWACTVFARRPETGEAIWAYQYNPHDLFDHDSINEHVLLDLPINGRTRKVLVHPERNGHMYVIDRATGEVLSAEPYAYTNTSEGVDLATGRLKYVQEKIPSTGKVVREICPPEPGAKD
jgi:lanthanide-dependent methanol dehydrogenase